MKLQEFYLEFKIKTKNTSPLQVMIQLEYPQAALKGALLSMKITLEGKAYIDEALKHSTIKTIRFYGMPSCCNVDLRVALEPATGSDIVQTIEGIQIAIDPEVTNLLADVTIHAEEKEGILGLVLLGYTPSPSCNH